MKICNKKYYEAEMIKEMQINETENIKHNNKSYCIGSIVCIKYLLDSHLNFSLS